MSLRDVNEATRRRLRVDAWLLTAWCVGVGFAASWLLLHAFGLRAPGPRYAIAALLMYSLGLVVGARVWLLRFNRALARAGSGLGHATADERMRHDAERDEARRRRAENRPGWTDWLDGGLTALDFGEASLLLLVPALIVAAGALLLAAGAAPVLLAEGVAGLLAEVALQFVFGALIARRVMRPRSHDEALLTIVGKTWLIGAVLVVASAATGFVLSWLEPGAASIADLWR